MKQINKELKIKFKYYDSNFKSHIKIGYIDSIENNYDDSIRGINVIVPDDEHKIYQYYISLDSII
jgi:hypothetical protein